MRRYRHSSRIRFYVFLKIQKRDFLVTLLNYCYVFYVFNIFFQKSKKRNIFFCIFCFASYVFSNYGSHKCICMDTRTVTVLRENQEEMVGQHPRGVQCTEMGVTMYEATRLALNRTSLRNIVRHMAHGLPQPQPALGGNVMSQGR